MSERTGWTFVEGSALGPPSLCSSCGKALYLRRYYNLDGMPSYLDCPRCRLTWELPRVVDGGPGELCDFTARCTLHLGHPGAHFLYDPRAPVQRPPGAP